MRWVIVVSALLFVFVPVGVWSQHDPTLADVLKQNSVSLPRGSVSHLNDAITSYATLNSDREFLIAYYLAAPRNELHFPLLIARFNKQSGKWDETSLSDLKVTLFAGTKQETQYECIGSAMHFESNGSWYYLDLHWTPSAGGLVILNRNLAVHQILTGWTAAFFKSGLLIYQRNMVHFAPVHPATLFLYDPVARRPEKIYPPKNDPFRKDFSNRLDEVIDEKRCQANNWPCDANNFESFIDYPVEVNDATHSLAFRVDFDTQGFLPRKEADESGKWDDDQYVYIYRLEPFGWRKFSVYDLKSKFGTDSLKELLTREKLRLVFATSGPQ